MAVTATPFKLRVPLAGKVVIWIFVRLLASTSLKVPVKSAEVKEMVVSSSTTLAILVTVGASLTAVILRLTVALVVA